MTYLSHDKKAQNPKPQDEPARCIGSKIMVKIRVTGTESIRNMNDGDSLKKQVRVFGRRSVEVNFFKA